MFKHAWHLPSGTLLLLEINGTQYVVSGEGQFYQLLFTLIEEQTITKNQAEMLGESFDSDWAGMFSAANGEWACNCDRSKNGLTGLYCS